MVGVPMRVKRWNWNEVKSEELAGLSVAWSDLPRGTPNELQAQMPGNAIVTKPAETHIHLVYCLPSLRVQALYASTQWPREPQNCDSSHAQSPVKQFRDARLHAANLQHRQRALQMAFSAP